MTSFDLSTVFRTVARAVPDQEALVWRDKRLTYSDLDQRIDAIAGFLVAAELGTVTERGQLEGHESGQDHLGLYLRNGNEYLESMVAGYRARVAPFNVNFRYVTDELSYLLKDANTKALIYHAEFAPEVAKVREQLPDLQVLIQVADESGNELLPGAVRYEAIIAAPLPDVVMPEPDGDDLFLLYTGGTTGMPKGVLWRQHDIYVSSMGGTPFGGSEPFASYEAIAEAAKVNPGGMKMLLTPPFMHGAAQWSTFHVITNGGTIFVLDDVKHFNAAEALDLAARERVLSIPVVGDAVARPLVEELERANKAGISYDLSGLAAVNNGSAPLSSGVRSRLLAALPHIMLLDAAGSSETGIQMSSLSAKDAETDPGIFTPQGDTAVVDDDLSRVLEPGESGGWLARSGTVPLGYLGDQEKTARTFPVINGVRWAVPGDRADVLDDGRIRLLGRESVTINSGGEKIFVEEVEQAILRHHAVKDAVVAGRPSERWGTEPVAVVSLHDGDVDDAELLAECAKHVARYKVPKAVVRVPEVLRSPSGKADYRWAKDLATQTNAPFVRDQTPRR